MISFHGKEGCRCSGKYKGLGVVNDQ
jgi:hypothetical protein